MRFKLARQFIGRTQQIDKHFFVDIAGAEVVINQMQAITQQANSGRGNAVDRIVASAEQENLEKWRKGLR